MGLASSQARMLLLTARKSDLEYRAQMISQRKINLAMQTQNLAQTYSQALRDQVMKFTYYTADGQSMQEKLSYAGITSNNADFVGDYIVKTANGKYAATSYEDSLRVAVKVANAEGFYSTEKSVTKYLGQADENGNQSEMTYANLKDEGYLVRGKNEEGKEVYLASSEADQITVAKMLAQADGKKWSDTIKDEYLAKVSIAQNGMLSSSSSVYEGLQNGNISLVKFSADKDDPKKGEYTSVDYDLKKCTKKETTEKVPVTFDLSKMSADEKNQVLADFQKKYGEIAIVTAMNNSDYFQDALRNGALFLFKKESADQTGYESLSWSADRNISDVADSSNDAEAEAEYESKSLVLSNQDKMLDLELNQIQTQHKAIETEYDSVKKVIEKNIDVSYKIFA